MALCADGEYFDGVVKECSSCRDACQPQLPLDPCIFNCPQYYREHVQPQVVKSTVVRAWSAATTRAYGQSTDHVPSLQYRLVSQPLFWTSVVSMLLALLCTIAIVVLCLTSSRRSRRARTAWSRGLRGSLSVAPPDGENKKLNLDDDDDNCSSTNINVDIDLRSTTSQEAGEFNQSRQSNPHGERQRGLVTAGAKVTSYASRSLEKVRSWFKMPSGHHQRSGLHSRLHTTNAGHPTQEESSTETKCCVDSVAETDCWSPDVHLAVSCSDQRPLMNEQYSGDETSQKRFSSERQQQQQPTVLTSCRCVQPLHCSECGDKRVVDVLTDCRVSTMRHNRLTSSLGYCSGSRVY